MTFCSFFGYSADALIFNASSGAVSLAPGCDAGFARLRFDVQFCQQTKGPDVRSDAGLAKVSVVFCHVVDARGACLASGPAVVKTIELACPGAGDALTLFEIGMGDTIIGYAATDRMVAALPYPIVARRQSGPEPEKQPFAPCAGGASEGALPAFAVESHEMAAHSSPATCFGPGTMITTDQGEIPVEWLDTSDQVLTRDHGFQPVRWIGRTRLSPGYFRDHISDSPVRVPAGALGNGLPTNDLHVTGNHRLLLRSPEAAARHGATEVLAPADAWADLGRAEAYLPENTYTLTHILCADHELLLAEGTWVESMFPCDRTLQRMSAGNRATFEMILGQTLYDMKTARPYVTRHEAHALIEKSRKGPIGRLPDTVRKRA